MELINAVILLLSTALPLIGATITFIAKFIKSDKGKKAAEDYIKINGAIEELMVKAEKLSGYSGQQKKSYVMRSAKNFALGVGIEFDEINAGEVIEKLISFSKGVNNDEKLTEPVTPAKKKRAGKKNISEESNEAGESKASENMKLNKKKEK